MDAGIVRHFRERVRQIQQKMGLSQRSDIQCCGVTMAQCHALLAIGERRELSIVELANILGIDSSNLSRTVDSLVKNGQVNRILNPQDRRYVSVSLTDEGKTTFETIDNLFNAYLSRVFESIPEEKHGQIMESLELVVNAFEVYGAKYQCCANEG
jgi:DNA-binding MarR family transcriptional regulator